MTVLFDVSSLKVGSAGDDRVVWNEWRIPPTHNGIRISVDGDVIKWMLNRVDCILCLNWYIAKQCTANH